MQSQSTDKPAGNRSLLLNVFFAFLIIAVAGGIIFAASRCLDSAHSNRQIANKLQLDQSKIEMAGIPEETIDMLDDTSVPLTGSEVIFEEANVLQDQGHYQPAIEKFGKVLEMLPAESLTRKTWIGGGVKSDKARYEGFVYQLRAYCFIQLKQYPLALKDLDMATKLRPEYAANFINRANVYKLMGQLDKAKKDEATAAGLKNAYVN